MSSDDIKLVTLLLAGFLAVGVAGLYLQDWYRNYRKVSLHAREQEEQRSFLLGQALLLMIFGGGGLAGFFLHENLPKRLASLVIAGLFMTSAWHRWKESRRVLHKHR